MEVQDKASVLYDDGHHRYIAYHSLVKGKGVQANQFLIKNGQHDILLDPGGDLLYAPLTIEILKQGPINELDYVFASHQDPDIISSMGKWLMKTRATIICSELWSRFLPHLVPGYIDGQNGVDLNSRIVGIPDKGKKLTLGDAELLILPAHFLHSVGNLNLYDPISKILFSGDIGASLGAGDARESVDNFDAHVQYMERFHQRYMCGNKACRLWVSMIRQLDVEMIVPQHGKAFVGKEMINHFLSWLENLACGVDLLQDDDYEVPH